MRHRPCSGLCFPAVQATGRPPVDRRTVIEATAWRFRTGAPLRDLPERFGNWNTIGKNFDRWSKAGVWAHGKGRALAFVLTGGQVADTTMLPDMLDEICVTGATGRPRQRADRLLADKGYPSKVNRARLRECGIPRRSRNVTTRSPTAASDLAARSTSVPSSGSGTGAATSSSAASTSSSSSAGSRCDQTRPPATTTPVSASPPHSTGFRPSATLSPVDPHAKSQPAGRTDVFICLDVRWTA